MSGQNGTPRPATNSELMLDALARVQDSTQAHRELLGELRGILRPADARLERELLTSDEPTWSVATGGEHASLAVLNYSLSAVEVGIAGRSATAGNGLPVPPRSFIVLPVRTNFVDVGAAVEDLAANGDADVVVLLFEKPQQLAAGALSSSPVASISDTTYDANGNLTAWRQDGVDYVATYDANKNLLTQGPA